MENMVDSHMKASSTAHTTAAPAPGGAIVYSRARWWVCFFAFAATTLNYFDRQVLGLLAPLLQQTLHWTESQYGFIITCFSVAYAIGYVSFGRVIDAIGTKLGYAAAALVWGIASCLHAFVGSVMGFAVVRFLLGLGESGNFPAAIKSTVEYFPPEQRALAMGWLNTGMNVAVQLTPIFIPVIVMKWGWHAAFFATGSLDLVWLAAWLAFPYNRLRPKIAGSTAPRLAFRVLLARRESWGPCVAKFLTDPIWWFYLYWLPKFFAAHFGLAIWQMRLPLTVVYLAASAGSVGGGALAGLLIRRSGSINFGRKMAMFLCGLCALPVVFASGAHSLWIAVAIIALAAGAHQGFSANLFITPADIFPQSEVASMSGLAGTFGALGGVVFAAGAGEVLQHTHNYSPLFIVAGMVYLVALFAFDRLAGHLPDVVPA
ncbi:MAG: MFS transporter [Terracidiphilus sp.]|jgi:ACS family hexuronate transporter-like MFS transporter